MQRSTSSHSISASRRSSSVRVIEEESVINGEQNKEEEDEDLERVHVAVKKDLKEGKSTLLWLLKSIDKERRKIVITHVHIPSQMIPMSCMQSFNSCFCIIKKNCCLSIYRIMVSLVESRDWQKPISFLFKFFLVIRI